MCPPSKNNAFGNYSPEALAEKQKGQAEKEKALAANKTLTDKVAADANNAAPKSSPVDPITLVQGVGETAASHANRVANAVAGAAPDGLRLMENKMLTDKVAADALAAANPKPKAEADTADILLRSAEGAALMRARASNGRKASFLSPSKGSLLTGAMRPQQNMEAMPLMGGPGWRPTIMDQTPSAAWYEQTAGFASAAGLGGDKKSAPAGKKGR